MDSVCIINNDMGLVDDKSIVLTIAIPTFKRYSLLKETLNSVFSLNFTIPIEVIIVDNDPENKNMVLEVMREFKTQKFKYYKNVENYGMFNNWNRCLELAKGELITILHDDDILDASFQFEFEKVYKGYKCPSDFYLVGFNVNIFDQREVSIKVKKNLCFKLIEKISRTIKKIFSSDSVDKLKKVSLQDLFLSGKFRGTLGVVMNRKRALNISGFDEKLYPNADYDFWLRWAQEYGFILYKNVKVGYYRIAENESLRSDVINQYILKNYEVRMRLVSEEAVLKNASKIAGIIKDIEEYSFKINLMSCDEFNVNLRDLCRFSFLKIKYYFMSKFLIK
ncbi:MULTISPECIES: glycosyltransferase family 2 protein [Yersinia pseudotuberculosis complex]|uniref:WbyS protein n=2 Tax=Yersinia pseudotuberculosis complex TaxID=1649845 RepID=B7ZEW1_YERPU|nr:MULTISPECIES: glycosyltransferase family 2 protein [Yersinia pseudotuberculosis complex]CAX18358.1 wbyS [Yersinia pseudotuberculosis]CRG49454.1 glycosyl transferase family protein [Yersinia wautersii]CRY69916.1 glycosyl transferase family protein [Yersinia pseudotuberculosis]